MPETKRDRTSVVAEIRDALGEDWLPLLYERKVRQGRTRSYSLEIPVRENKPEIQYTLLGIELKVGKRRLACPDLATARYLRVFARLGCREVAVPYDITKISGLADELETSWQRAVLLLQKKKADLSRTKLIRTMRDAVTAAGPGDKMPSFDRETRQRKV